MNSEFSRLSKLRWKEPTKEPSGIYKPAEIDEDTISFPGDSYSGEELNFDAAGFWAIERANAIARELQALNVNLIWEIGAGNGNVAIPLRDLGFQVIAVEPLFNGALTLAKNDFTTFQSTLESLKLPDNSIGAIGVFDVLEHLENPEPFLNEVSRVLKPGGIFICSVPAYQWLYSDFDISLGHFRRYSEKTLTQLLKSSKLESINVRFLFGFLIIPALLLRRIPYLLGRRNKFARIKHSNNQRFRLLTHLDGFLRALLAFESRIQLRIGLSIIAISQKSDAKLPG
jgi:SAM-dependent methyltransferase